MNSTEQQRGNRAADQTRSFRVFLHLDNCHGEQEYLVIPMIEERDGKKLRCFRIKREDPKKGTVRYDLKLDPQGGDVVCSCPDFMKAAIPINEGCKHRAALVKLYDLLGELFTMTRHYNEAQRPGPGLKLFPPATQAK